MFYTLDSANFGEYISKSKGLVVVNFWTPWSDECRYMSSLMASVQHQLDEQDLIVQVDWDQERQLVEKLDVLGVPTLLLFICGNEVARFYGTMSEDDLRKYVAEARRSEDNNNVRPYPNDDSPTKRRI
jgi:thioredoxin-like negative regulator of GroEL